MVLAQARARAAHTPPGAANTRVFAAPVAVFAVPGSVFAVPAGVFALPGLGARERTLSPPHHPPPGM
ncbi:hypothetical protein GCM10027445_07480 [Amycolatopsis endophytica]